MEKSDLKNGMVVELRNGEIGIVLDNELIISPDALDGDKIWLSRYNDDLTHYRIKTDIVKIWHSMNDWKENNIMWERKETPKLTNDEKNKEIHKLTEYEKNILKSVYPWKWIARYKNGALCVYQMKPIRLNSKGFWRVSLNDDSCYICLSQLIPTNNILAFITWDSEPYKITDLLLEEN